jgi:hypothetical protein
MNGNDLRARFESLSLPPDEFSHEAHVQVAWSYLAEHPLLEVLRLFPANLKRFAANAGAANKYHATVTWAFLFAIADRIEECGERESWERFIERNRDLLQSDFLGRYYTKEILDSDAARSRFILPRR